MQNNLSIESIKETLIDRLMNNVEVLEYLEADEFMKKYNNIQIKDLYNELIYGYGKTEGYKNWKNWISVEVNERSITRYYRRENGSETIDNKYYEPIIIVQTNHKYLDKLVSVIKEICLKEYPNLCSYNNTYDYVKYNRVISFCIEE